MTREEIARIVTLLGLLAIAGCGGGADFATGSLAVQVTNAKSFDPRAPHGRIERYVVRIEGEGIAPPIEATFAGDVAGGVIDHVPVGERRLITVEAINPNDATIRAGEEENVTVTDEQTTVAVAMEAVPIFTNLTQGTAIDNTRLAFRLFSDPAHPVVVEEIAGEAATALVDAATSVADIQLDAATGLGRLSPALLAPGRHRFAVRDVASGRQSTAEVLLLDGTKRRAAPLFAAGSSDGSVATRVGPVPAAR